MAKTKTKTMRVKAGDAEAPKMVNHSERAHALLSASGASRWINCPPSAKLEELEGERQDTVFTREGTLAHEIAELFVRHDVLKDVSDAEFTKRFGELQEDELYADDMIAHAAAYADYYKAAYGEALTRNEHALLEVEQKLDLTEYVPESFGTADGVIISDGIMEVIDYKYGAGVRVSPDWNPQGMLYALGALRKYDLEYDISEVRVTIIQPRMDHIETFSISVQDLRQWAENVAKPAAELAFKGEGEKKTGYWCKFCSVKAKCRLQMEENLAAARDDFGDPDLLTDDELSGVLSASKRIREWLDAVEKYATEKATKDGKVWPGYKLVRANTRQKWTDEEEAASFILGAFPELSEDEIYKASLRSITDIKKLVGKAGAEMLSQVIIKPEGAPTLVELSDPRPAIGLEEAINDFKE